MTERAIPGQPTRWAAVPPDAPARAVAAIKALSSRLERRSPFGFLDPPFLVGCHWLRHNTHNICRSVIDLIIQDDWTDWRFELGLVAAAHTTSRGECAAVIQWRWGVLWDSGDWYEVGWHPDGNFWRLQRQYGDTIWATLNPGKEAPRATERVREGRSR